MAVSDELRQLEEAILAIENGAQSYQIGSRQLTRGNILHYYNERRRLKAELAAENGNSTVVAQFDGR